MATAASAPTNKTTGVYRTAFIIPGQQLEQLVEDSTAFDSGEIGRSFASVMFAFPVA